MFTLEIDGTAIAVIGADEPTARDLFTCDGFKDDIRTMTSGGRPLWNGTSALTVRAASADEIEEFEEAIAGDDGTGDFEPDAAHGRSADASPADADDDETDGEDDEDEADIVFLVDLDDDRDELDA